MKKTSILLAIIITVQMISCTMSAVAKESFEKELLSVDLSCYSNPNDGEMFFSASETNESGEYIVGKKNGVPVIYNADENKVVWELATYSNIDFSKEYTLEVDSFSADEKGNIYFVFSVCAGSEKKSELWGVIININGVVNSKVIFEGLGESYYVQKNENNQYLARVIIDQTVSGYTYYGALFLSQYSPYFWTTVTFAQWVSFIDESGFVFVIDGTDGYEYIKIDGEGNSQLDEVGRLKVSFVSEELLYIAEHLTGDFYSFSTNMYSAQLKRDKGIINISTGEKLVAEPKYTVAYIGDDIFELRDMTDFSYKYINIDGEEVPEPEKNDNQYAYEVPEYIPNGVYQYKYDWSTNSRTVLNNVTGELLFQGEISQFFPAGKNKQILIEAKYNPEKVVFNHYDWYLLKPVLTEQQKSQMLFKIDNNYVNVYGNYTYSDVAPIIINSRTMLPARIVAENLGANVEWDGVARKVIITKDNTEIILIIDSNIAYCNGVAETLDSPAIILNDRTYTPVRYIAEKLGATVAWDNDTRTAIITK